MSEHWSDQLERQIARWHARRWPVPAVAVVAGSGLSVELPGQLIEGGALADLLPFPIEAIEGHPLEWQLVALESGPIVLYFRGRLHAYQGYSAAQVVFCVRLAALLGASRLLISNAAGCLRPEVPPGRLWLIRDQINLTGLNPLTGHPPSSWGPRFPDLGQAYAQAGRERARRCAEALGIPLAQGVYAGLLGPSYETPAEVEMLRRMGADLVGMSTVLEVIAARHMGMEVLGFSLASNPAAGLAEGALDHQEVLDAGRAAAADFGRLLIRILEEGG